MLKTTILVDLLVFPTFISRFVPSWFTLFVLLYTYQDEVQNLYK